MSFENSEWSSNNAETEWRPIDTIKRVYITDIGGNWRIRMEFEDAAFHDISTLYPTEQDARDAAKQLVDETLIRR